MAISNLAISVLVNLVLSLAPSSSVDGWRGIVPLRSTRGDVERLLGPGGNWCACAYYLEKENIFFAYSTGTCKSGGSGGWDVPPGTVLKITVYPKPKPRLSAVGIDLRRFQRRQDGHLASIVSYVSEEEGLIIEVDEDRDVVKGFYYGPSAKNRDLRCR